MEASGSCKVETQDVAEQHYDLGALVTMFDDALDTDDEVVDPTFDLDSCMESDTY